MRKYQCFECTGDRFNASYKAPADICRFAEGAGFETIPFFSWGLRSGVRRIAGHIKRFSEWLFLCFKVRHGSVLLLQFPYVVGGRPYRVFILRLMRTIRKVRIITMVHDVNELRYDEYDNDKRLLDDAVNLSDILIVHNRRMREYFESKRNVSSGRIVELEMFDYFTKHEFRNITDSFEKSLTVAGNLDVKKCPYLGRLGEFQNMKFHLYGKNYTQAAAPNIVYHGPFDSNQIMEQLVYGFGLVWDGTNTDTCAGSYGSYLRYNNPHKLSLYLVAGVPVVVWSESACAGFVRANGVGICVSSIGEAVQKVNAVTLSEYQVMRGKCIALSQKMRDGFFIKRALDAAVTSF